MIIKRIGALSLGKLMGAMYTGIGLLVGCIFALISLLGGGAMMASGQRGSGLGMGMMAGLGVLAIVLFPIFYGLLGFVAGVISAFFYNLAAKYAGGLEIDVE